MIYLFDYRETVEVQYKWKEFNKKDTGMKLISFSFLITIDSRENAKS